MALFSPHGPHVACSDAEGRQCQYKSAAAHLQRTLASCPPRSKLLCPPRKVSSAERLRVTSLKCFLTCGRHGPISVPGAHKSFPTHPPHHRGRFALQENQIKPCETCLSPIQEGPPICNKRNAPPASVLEALRGSRCPRL